MSNPKRTISQIQNHVWTQLEIEKIRFDHPNYRRRLIGEAWKAGATREQLDELCANDNEKLDVYGLSTRLVRVAGKRRRSWHSLLKAIDREASTYVASMGGDEWLRVPPHLSDGGLSPNLQLTASFVSLLSKGVVTLIGKLKITNIHQAVIYYISVGEGHHHQAFAWVGNSGPAEIRKFGKLRDTFRFLDIMATAFDERYAVGSKTIC
jgi:hypothetical protein